MRKYKVGDKVTIRSWESMEREFGLNENGSINIPPHFTTEMKEYCGKQATILSDLRNDKYKLVDCGWQMYAPQMFTDWETDKQGVDKMKLQYEGQEVETITEGYWPEGVELIASDTGSDFGPLENVVCLRTREDGYGVAITKDGHASAHWRYWAIKPTEPAQRRLTNREVAELVTEKRFSVLDGEWVYHYMTYKAEYENDPTPQGVKLRAPGSDEWLEPTSELLEVGK